MLQCVAAVPEDGKLLGGLGGGDGLLGGLGGLGNIGNTLTQVAGGLPDLNTVTKSLTSVTSVASTLVKTVTQTVTKLTAVTNKVSQLAGTLSKLTTTATGLPASVLQFTKTITFAFTTVTQVVSEASNLLGQGTKLTEAITQVQTSVQVLVKHLTSSPVDVTIVQKSVTTVVTSIKYFISATQGYLGGATKLLNSSPIVPVANAVGKILVSMQSVLEIVSSTITTVQAVTKTTSNTTIIKTTLEKLRGLVQHFTNQISDPSLIPSLLQTLLGNIGGISSAFPAESPTDIVPGGTGDGTPIQPPNQGFYNGPDGNTYPPQGSLDNQQSISPPEFHNAADPIIEPNLPQYPQSPQTVDSEETPISNWPDQTHPDNNVQQHSFWNYPVILAQPDRQVGPEYQPTNFGNQRPAQSSYWESPTGGQENSGPQVNTIGGPYQPDAQIVFEPNRPINYPDEYSPSTNIGNQGPAQSGYWEGPIGGQENSEPQVNTNGGSYQPNAQIVIEPNRPINYPDGYLPSTDIGSQGPAQSGYWEGPTGGQQNSGPLVNTIGGPYQPNAQIVIEPINQGDNLDAPINENDQIYGSSIPDDNLQLPQSQQTFSNLATPQVNGPISGNYQFPSQASENYPLIDQSSYPVLENSGISYPVPSSLSGNYPNYPINTPSLPSISTSGPEYTTPLSENYLFPSQTYGNYPSIVQSPYAVPENYPSILQSPYPVPENSGASYPVPSSLSGSYPNYPTITQSLPSELGYPASSATTPVSSATSSASASPGHATASASATTSNVGHTPSFSGPKTSISIFRKYEIALGDIFTKILDIIATMKRVPTDQLAFAVKRTYSTIHTLMLFVSQLNGYSATSPNSVDIIFNIINELSGNLQDLVQLAQQIASVQGTSTPLLTILKLTSAVTALTINQVQKLAQQIDTSPTNFVLQSSIDRVLLNLIYEYGQLYPGNYTGQIDQPNGVSDLFNALSTSNQSYQPIYHEISHGVIRAIKNIIQQSAQTIQNSDNDYIRLLNIVQALPLNQDQIHLITYYLTQMNNNLNTVSYRLESINAILNDMSGYGHTRNFDYYTTVTQSSSSSSASSTSSSDGTDTSTASASSSSTTITAPYSQLVKFAGPLANNLLSYSGNPVLQS